MLRLSVAAGEFQFHKGTIKTLGLMILLQMPNLISIP